MTLTIGFSFLVGGDKRVYEGRGWRVKPESSEKLLDGGLPDERALLVAYIGPFEGNRESFYDLNKCK